MCQVKNYFVLNNIAVMRNHETNIFDTDFIILSIPPVFIESKTNR